VKGRRAGRVIEGRQSDLSHERRETRQGFAVSKKAALTERKPALAKPPCEGR